MCHRSIAFSFKSFSFGSMFSLVSTKEAAEVHSLGDTTIIFDSYDSVWIKETTSSFGTKDMFQEELFFTLGKVLAM